MSKPFKFSKDENDQDTITNVGDFQVTMTHSVTDDPKLAEVMISVEFRQGSQTGSFEDVHDKAKYIQSILEEAISRKTADGYQLTKATPLIDKEDRKLELRSDITYPHKGGTERISDPEFLQFNEFILDTLNANAEKLLLIKRVAIGDVKETLMGFKGRAVDGTMIRELLDKLSVDKQERQP